MKDCIEVTSAHQFYIEDDDDSKITVLRLTPSNNDCCTIINPKETEAVVLSIDHKLIDNHKGSIANGAVFNTSSFHFVEFKTNAVGNR